MSTDDLLASVRAHVARELEGFDISRLVLRLSDDADRSVLVIARLGGDAGAMVTRVYEADLRRRGVLTPTYLAAEDVDLVVDALSSEGVASRTMDAPIAPNRGLAPPCTSPAIPGARPGADT